MSFDWASSMWTSDDLGRGLPLLAGEASLGTAQSTELFIAKPKEPERIGEWIEALASGHELEVEAITAAYGELDVLVGRVGPAMLRVWAGPPEAEPEEASGTGPPSTRPSATPEDGWVLVLGAESSFSVPKIRILTPDGSVRSLAVRDLVTRLKAPIDARHRGQTEALLVRAQVPAVRRGRAVEALLVQRLAETPMAVGYMVRSAPEANFHQRLSRLGVFRRLTGLMALHGLQYALWLMSWWLIGRAALSGTLAAGWMVAWVLLLLSLVPLRMGTAWLMGSLSIRVGSELKRRLLHGALNLDRDAMRAEGAGGSLGRVIEAEAVESLAIGGGLTTLTALIELPFALWVLSQGLSGGWLVVVLTAVLFYAVWAGWRYRGALEIWTERRLTMTHGLVEKMAGHRTRLAQELDRHLHRGEDLELKDYLQHLEGLDRAIVRLLLLPRSWMLLALLWMAPAFIAGQGSAGSLAVAIGGILLVQGVLGSLTGGLSTLGAAWISWARVEPLFRAGGEAKERGLPQLALETSPATSAATGPSCTPSEPAEPAEPEEATSAAAPAAAPVIIHAKGLAYSYAARSRPVLTDGDMTIRAGDRLLVEGPSGGGKSTLAALLVGLRQPDAGTLSLHGVDRRSLGLEAWRRRVVLVPQFHDNHVLTETFAFNLLMGRGWPAVPDDFREAWMVCRELGLGDLLARMPGGLQQMVGETGWQLSHGERSRLFLARALLQDADLLILDESFAALDPENLQLARDCARRRGRTILVIAHP